jgi:outer membrane protein OmpA-like peptidoglycan-associated protein
MSRKRAIAAVAVLLTSVAWMPGAFGQSVLETPSLTGDTTRTEVQRPSASNTLPQAIPVPPPRPVVVRDLQRLDLATGDQTRRVLVERSIAGTSDVVFAPGSDRLDDSGRVALRVLARALLSSEHATGTFMIGGYGDLGEASVRSAELGARRARVVRDFLVDAGRVPENRLLAAGWMGTSAETARQVTIDRIRLDQVDLAMFFGPGGVRERVIARAPVQVPTALVVPTTLIVRSPAPVAAVARPFASGFAERVAGNGCPLARHDLDDFQPGGPFVPCEAVSTR